MEILSFNYYIETIGDTLVGVNKNTNKKFDLCKASKETKQFAAICGVRGFEIIEYICNSFTWDLKDEGKLVIFEKYFVKVLKNVGREQSYFFLK